MTFRMERRNFLSTSAALAIGLTLPKVAFSQAAEEEVFTNASLGAYGQGLMSLATFKGLRGSLFMVYLPHGRVSFMTLKSAEPYVARSASTVEGTHFVGRAAPHTGAKAPVTESFTAVFSTDDAGIEQGTYLVDHGRLGRVALFLVPGQKLAGAMTCCATFNYLLSTPTWPVPTRARRDAL